MQFLKDMPGGMATVGTAATLSAAAMAYYVASRPQPLQTGVDMDNQSITLEVIRTY